MSDTHKSNIPLLVGHWEQFGVTSYGSPYCTGDTPTVYCNIIDHKDWIESVSGMYLYLPG